MFDGPEFPTVKTFYEEVEDIAKAWAWQNKCSYEEATQVVLGFAQQIHNKAATSEATPSTNQVGEKETCGICGDGGHTAFACPNQVSNKEVDNGN